MFDSDYTSSSESDDDVNKLELHLSQLKLKERDIRKRLRHEKRKQKKRSSHNYETFTPLNLYSPPPMTGAGYMHRKREELRFVHEYEETNHESRQPSFNRYGSRDTDRNMRNDFHNFLLPPPPLPPSLPLRRSRTFDLEREPRRKLFSQEELLPLPVLQPWQINEHEYNNQYSSHKSSRRSNDWTEEYRVREQRHKSRKAYGEHRIRKSNKTDEEIVPKYSRGENKSYKSNHRGIPDSRHPVSHTKRPNIVNVFASRPVSGNKRPRIVNVFASRPVSGNKRPRIRNFFE